jgi:D-3-phosphoglycerate dehydrogenase
MLTRKILLLQPIHDAGMALLRKRNDVQFTIASGVSDDILIREAHDAHAIIARASRVTAQVIDAAESLCVVSRHGVGYDNVDVARLSQRGIPLTIAIAANALSVAEHTLYLILALAKQGFRFDREVKRNNFDIRAALRGTDIANKFLLVVGCGRTGSRVAKFARAFDMKVFVYDPYIDQALITALGCIPVDDYRSVLPDMDMVTMHCPLTEETRGMISEAEFGAMKATAYVINCARGSIVDEQALYAALKKERIAGAGLDVFASEPPPADDPLLELDNLITSPHIAGVTLEASMRMATGAVENVLAAFDGTLDPAFVVNREVLRTEADQ